MIARSIEDMLATFAAKTEVDHRHGCILWTGATNNQGYGVVGIGGGKTALAHRAAYEVYYGELPDGPLDHTCTVNACVCPLHLEPVTTAENNRRATRKRDAERTRGGVLHCPQGHAIEGENRYVYASTGHVECRSCRYERNRRWRAARRAAA